MLFKLTNSKVLLIHLNLKVHKFALISKTLKCEVP